MKQKKKFLISLLLLCICMTLCMIPSPAVSAAKSKTVQSSEKTVLKNTFSVKNKKIYYYNSKGKLVKKKWMTIDNNRYYFCKDGHAATGFCTISGKRYCFTSKGILRTGWYTAKGETYYLNLKTGVVSTGRKKIGGKEYYFSSKGVLQKNKWINGKYYNSAGVYDPTKKEPLTNLKKKLQNAIKGYSGTWSIYVKNLDTGESICLNNKKMYAASLIKLYAMAAAYDKIGQGKLKESSIQATISNMITLSDNWSFNHVLHKIGRTYINTWCKKNGYKDTRQYHGFAGSNNNGLRTSSSSNVTTVKDCGLLLESIYNKTCVSKSASSKMLKYLKAQTRRSKIPAGIPSGVTVANKTGETNDTTHDAAIVYSKGADYIICVMGTCPGYAWYAASNVTKLSRIVYNYFN